MNENQLEQFSVAEVSPNPRYANKSSARFKRQSIDEIKTNYLPSFQKPIESAERMKRQIQSTSPLEYTIYLRPDQDPDSSLYGEPQLNQIRAIYPIGVSHSPKNASCKPDLIYPSNTIQKTNPIQYANYQVQRPYSNYAAAAPPAIPNPRSPTNLNPNPNTLIAQSAFQNINPNFSLRPSPTLASPPPPKPSSICRCPIKPVPPPTGTVTFPPPITVPSLPLPPVCITTPKPPVCVTTPKPPVICNCPTSTLPPPTSTTTVPIQTTTSPYEEPTTSMTTEALPLTTTTEAPTTTSVPITTEAPTETTTNCPNTTPSGSCNCQHGNGKCGIVIKNAVILINRGFNTTNISALVNALRQGDDDDHSNDSQENDDIPDLDGIIPTDEWDDENGKSDGTSTQKTQCQSGLCIQNAIVKSSITESKIVDLLEKVYKELQKPKKGRSELNCDYDDDFPDDDNDSDDSTASMYGERNDSNVDEDDESNCSECDTGKDLVEACKHLSKTISSYQGNRR